VAGDDRLAVAREALQTGSWATAKASFEEALRRRETLEALEGLAEAAFWLEDAPTVIEARERAFRLYREAGDDEAAARAAAMLAVSVLIARGDSAVAAGWLGRARSLLQAHPDSPVLAMVAGMEGALASQYEKDFARARPLLQEAIARARAMGFIDGEMLSMGQLGLLLVRAGDVAEGMRMLDEATAAAVAGELTDVGNAVRVCCMLVTACLHVRDLERAAQWARYVIGQAGGRTAGPLFDYPRTEHAATLVWWGRWEEADRVLLDVLRDAAGRPVSAAMGRLRLADLRRRQGRLDEAQDLLDQLDQEPHRAGLGQLTVAARAVLELDHDRPREAAELAERYLRAVPTADRVERIDALETLARARAALGNPEAAAEALAELEDVAARIGTGPVRASALFASGVVAAARGAHATAREALERSMDLFAGGGSPVRGGAGPTGAGPMSSRPGSTGTCREGGEHRLRRLRRAGGSPGRRAGRTPAGGDRTRCQRPSGPPTDPAGGRGSPPPRSGSIQRGDRRRAVSVGADRGTARRERLRQDRRARTGRPRHGHRVRPPQRHRVAQGRANLGTALPDLGTGPDVSVASAS
jgi:tetratricopeptide (TPR) repeat protein